MLWKKIEKPEPKPTHWGLIGIKCEACHEKKKETYFANPYNNCGGCGEVLKLSEATQKLNAELMAMDYGDVMSYDGTNDKDKDESKTEEKK